MRRVVWIYISASIFHVWLNEDSWILISASAVSCAKLFSFFPLSSLRVCLLCHSFLALVSAEKLADDLTGVLWHVICHFSLVSFNILSWSLIFVSLITMCLGVFLLGFILSGTLCFLDLVDYFVSYVREVFNYYLFRYFLWSFLSLSSFWDPYNATVGVFNVPEVSQAVFIFFFLFSIFYSAAVTSTILSSLIYLFCFSYSAMDSF